MDRRWLIGAGWVGAVTVGAAVLLATGQVASGPQPPPGSLSSATGTAPDGRGGPGGLGEEPAAGPAAGPSASPPGTSGSGSALPTAGLPGGAGSGSVTTPPLDRAQAAAPPGSAAAPAPGQPVAPGGGPASPPARVAAVSYLLDVLESVSRVSPGVANGAAATVLGSALQGLPGPVQETVASGAAKLAEQLSAEVPRTIGDVRSMVAHLSVANPEVNQALSLAATALSGMATPAISPLHQTALQLSKALEALAEPDSSPSP